MIACTFNGAKFIREQLVSIIMQSRPPDEILIFDDCSTDNTLQLINEVVQETAFPVHLHINSRNKGFVRNFEFALSQCTNDIVLFSDQDDVWLDNKISRLEEIFTQNQSIVCITHDGEFITETSERTGYKKNEQISRAYGKTKIPITGALTAIRRSCIDMIHPFPSNVTGHDIWLTYFFNHFPDRWLIITDTLQYIRRHDSNTSQWVVNEAKKVGRIDVFKEEFKTRVASSYFDRLLLNKTLRERVLSCEFFAQKKISFSHKSSTLSQLQRERRAICSRHRIARTKRKFKRTIMSIFMLVTFQYRYFNGIKSFARDFFRRL